MKTQKVVTPVQTGVHTNSNYLKVMDSGFRRNNIKGQFPTFYKTIKIDLILILKMHAKQALKTLIFSAMSAQNNRKLLDEVRDFMRLHHYSIHTERTYCDWIKRFVQFHHMKSQN
jgi:hypothetical protein